MSSKVLIDTQSPFRKSHTASRSSGSKTQRDVSSSNQGNPVNFFGHNLQQSSNGVVSNEGIVNLAQSGYQQVQQPHQSGTLYQQQQRTTRNNSENRHSTTSINGNSLSNNTSSSTAGINTSNSTSLKANQILRNNSNFSATPQKKKDQISMYIIESGGGKISHSTSLNHNYNQNPYSNSKLNGSQQISNGCNGISSSGVKQSSSQSASSSSQKYLNQNSIFNNNFAKENVGLSMHKHSVSSSIINSSKIPTGSLNNASSNSGGNQQNINACNNSIISNSNINSNLTNSGNNQNVFYQIQNQNNSNNNNTSASLSPNQKTLYQNILNSSWKVNMMPNQTPRKGGDSCSTGSTINSTLTSTANGGSVNIQSSSNNSSSKILSNSSRSYSKTSARQQPYIQENNYQHVMNTSGKVTGQNMSPLNQSSSNNANPISRLNTSTSSSSKAHQNEEIKRLKMEIEQFKNREIKYLVRIATLEKETKKLSENLEKQETINKDISLENSKMRRMNSFNNTSMNMSYCGNSADKNLLANNLGNNINLTSSIDELQRSLRQQKSDLQDSTPQNNSNNQSNPINSGNCCQCGLNSSNNSYGLNSGTKQTASSLTSQNSASYNKYKVKYTQLRNQHKDIIKRCIEVEKENKEIKSESQLMRQLYLEKISIKQAHSVQSESNSQNNISNCPFQQNSSNQSNSSTLNAEGNQSEKIPSFMKVLALGQAACN